MSIVTIGDFKNYLQTVANAVSSGKMNVNDAEVKSVLQTIAAAVGEVSATPTANTLADRLKAIADRLGEASANPTANTALARLKALEGYLDGVEAALGTQSDAEATGNGSIIAILKRLRAILSDVWNDTANALNVQLTGRQVEKLTPINAMALTDTTLRRVSVDLKKYSRIFVIAKNTHDQAVEVYIYTGPGTFSSYPTKWDSNNNNWTQDRLVQIPSSSVNAFLLNTRFPWLETATIELEFGVKATVAPTSGSVTIEIWGVV